MKKLDHHTDNYIQTQIDLTGLTWTYQDLKGLIETYVLWFYIHKLNNTFDKHMGSYGRHQPLPTKLCYMIETRDHVI